MSTIRVNTIQHSSANGGNMILHANGNVSMLTANSTLFIGNTAISNAGISISGSAMSAASGMRNRIINGAMVIDQRYAGAANTVPLTTQLYTLDRWIPQNYTGTGLFTVQQRNASNTSASNYEADSAPAGFLNSLKMTVTTANTTPTTTNSSGIGQAVEGLNISDLDWGKATAKPVTLSFWCKSNVTGQYSIVFYNSDATRIYTTSFTVNSTNTWEQKILTVPGDTTGTWLTNNGLGVFFKIWLSLGSTYLTATTGWNSSQLYGITGQSNWLATVGNTFYITGVQLEAGTVATPFEFRQYGQELALCQRYYQIMPKWQWYVYNTNGSATVGTMPFPVEMRTTPTITQGTYTNGQYASPITVYNSGNRAFLCWATATASATIVFLHNADDGGFSAEL